MIPQRWVGAVSAVGLGVAFLAAIAIQSFALAQTWGAASWAPGAATAVMVCALALMRHRERTWTAAGGLVVTALAVLVPLLPGTRFPAGLGPAVALGLAVLTGSAIRALPMVRAGAIAGAGLLVIAVQFAVRPPSAVPAIAAAAWLAAVGVGLALRMFDGRAKAAAEEVRRAERLELARELHDIVAHHITGMVIQAQAAHIVVRRAPEKVSDSLTEIESAGSEAMAAMRRVVGLLRDTDDAAPVSPGPERLSTLAFGMPLSWNSTSFTASAQSMVPVVGDRTFGRACLRPCAGNTDRTTAGADFPHTSTPSASRVRPASAVAGIRSSP